MYAKIRQIVLAALIWTAMCVLAAAGSAFVCMVLDVIGWVEFGDSIGLATVISFALCFIEFRNFDLGKL